MAENFVPPPKGWLKGLLTAPFANMHTHLHKLRMAVPPAEHPEIVPITDARPYQPSGMLPPKPPAMRPPTELAPRRDSSAVPPFPLRPPYDQ